MKVVMINNLYAPNVRGGAERSVQLLAEALVRAGVQVTVICADRREHAAVELNGVKVVTLATANLYWPFGDAAPTPLRRKLWHLLDVYSPIMRTRIENVLRDERPAIVHTHNLQGITVSAWQAAKSRGLPVLHTLRDYYLSCARASRFRDGRNCARTCAGCVPFCAARRRASGVVDAVAGTGRFILERHLELGFFRQAVWRTVITNPAVAVESARPSGRHLVFGYLGRLEPAKGVELLLRTFAARDDDGWELWVAGAGPPVYVEELQRQASQARRAPQIRFLGWVDGAEFLRRVDVVVVPSLWHEPLSRAAIEAQVSGVAVIATRRGGLPEIVEDESTGWLFEPDEAGALERVIERIVRQPELARRYGAAAAAAADRFRPETNAMLYVQAYESVLRGSRSDE